MNASATPLQKLRTLRIAVWSTLVCTLLIGIVFIAVLKSKELSYVPIPTLPPTPVVEPFPVGIDIHAEEIVERKNVEEYLDAHFAKTDAGTTVSFFRTLQKKLLGEHWYQNLASAHTRVLVIYAGERKEEVVDSFGDILRWDEQERNTFQSLVLGQSADNIDGVFFPGTYVVDRYTTPQEMATEVIARFNQEVTIRYTPAVTDKIPLQTALVVASLLEREAYTFEDMRIISGVIWNRLFVDMKLQLDATLQYAKASDPHERYWWPQVQPRDKYIDSAFNTYQHKGLPPAPIANPSSAAILAALNPVETDCLFYFHHTNGDMYCSLDYLEHVQKLRTLYGQGR